MTLDQFTTPDGGSRLHLRASGVGVVLDVPATGLPRIQYWRADLGELAAGPVSRRWWPPGTNGS